MEILFGHMQDKFLFSVGGYRRYSSGSMHGQSANCGHNITSSGQRFGCKARCKDSRCKFHFQSFVSFSVALAHRTIMALWRARSLSPERKAEIAEEESDDKSLQMLEEESSSIKSDDHNENRSLLPSEEIGSFLSMSPCLLCTPLFFRFPKILCQWKRTGAKSNGQGSLCQLFNKPMGVRKARCISETNLLQV